MISPLAVNRPVKGVGYLRCSLTRFAWLSIAAAVVTIGLKLVAYRLTGSVGLLSDAIELVVNLVGGIMALAMLTVAARPADEDHPYGHGKAEYFSNGVEGTLILLAAVRRRPGGRTKDTSDPRTGRYALRGLADASVRRIQVRVPPCLGSGPEERLA